MKNCYILLLVLFVSCIEKINQQESTIKKVEIDLKSSNDGKLSEVYEELEYVLLENSGVYSIVRPYKVSFSKGIIGIEDRGGEQYLFYDPNGLPLFKIKATGEGPGEFLRTEDFQIFEDSIVIKDAYLGKFLTYDRQGNFLAERKARVNHGNFWIGEKAIFYYSKNIFQHGPFNFYIENNEEIHTALEVSQSKENIVYSDKNGFMLDNNQGNIVFKIPFSNQVVFFDVDGNLTKNVCFDFKEFSVTEEHRSTLGENQIFDLVQQKNLVNYVSSFFPIENGYFISFGVGFKESHQVFLDENFMVKKHIKNIKNDLDHMPIGTIPWFYTSNKIGYLMPSSEFYADYLEKFKSSEKRSQANNLHRFIGKYGDRLGEDSYVLILLKLK